MATLYVKKDGSGDAVTIQQAIQLAQPGDIVEIGCELVSVGRTSITIACEVRNKDTKQSIIKIDKIVFVLLDNNGVPKPHGKKK